MALAGADGQQAAGLLRASVKQGAAALGTLTEQALWRYLALPTGARAGQRLFNRSERHELSQILAATNATADLLGRARIRRRLQQAEKHYADRDSDGSGDNVSRIVAAAKSPHPIELPASERGRRERSAGYARFAEQGTDYSCFADHPIQPLPPLRALDWFRKLIPGLFPKDDADAFDARHQQLGFTLAVTTEQTLLERIHELIGRVLASGQKVRATPKIIDTLLDDAGVSPANPQYAEMVFRTNMMGAYSRGGEEELEEVKDHFPVWRYVGIRDGRQGKDHEQHFDKYYPSSAKFTDVRGDRPYNCRCTFIPIYTKDWQRLQAAGVGVSKFSEPIPVPPVRQSTAYTCGPATLAAVARHFGRTASAGYLSRLLGTTEEAGTSPNAMLIGCRKLGLAAEASDGMTPDDLQQALARRSPVIICLQAYGTPGEKARDEAGHWCAVKGWDGARFELIDPASDDDDGVVSLTPEELTERWHDESAERRPYVRFGIVVGGPRI